MSVISPIGLTFAHMYLASVQDLSYKRGFMGNISETELKNLIENAKNGGLIRDGNSWSQEFGSATSTAFNWNQVRSTPAGQLDLSAGKQGAFQYKLIQESSDKKKWNLEIIVRWKIDLKYSLLSKYVGSSKEDIITSFINSANIALYEYWVRNNLHGNTSVKLVSIEPDVTVELRPKAIKVGNNEQYIITIFPDNGLSDMGLKPEVVQFDSSGHKWFAREEATFAARFHGDRLSSGNGPHEFGHMMGLPHDIALTGSYMYSGNVKSTAGLQYKFGGNNKAWASHYRIIKYWAESIMIRPEVLGKKMDFIVQV